MYVSYAVVKIKSHAFLDVDRQHNGSESIYKLKLSVVSVRVCERTSVFSSCRYMCATSVSPYLLSSFCFNWHMCIVKRHVLPTSEKQTGNHTHIFPFFS